MSWRSVLDEQPDTADDAPADAPNEALAAPDAPAAVPTDPVGGIGPIHLEIPPLRSLVDDGADRPPLVAPPSERPIEPLGLPSLTDAGPAAPSAPSGPAAHPAGDVPVAFAIPGFEPDRPDVHPATPVVAAADSLTDAGPVQATSDPRVDPAAADSALPHAVPSPPAPPDAPGPSAAPATPAPPAPPDAPAPSATPVAPATDAPAPDAPIPAAPTPAVPQVPQIPQIPAPTVGPQPVVNVPAPVVAPAPTPAPARVRPPAERGGGRRIFGFMLTIIVLGGLVAAAVFVGRPYLFPEDWDADVKPYALAVEGALGVEFVEPVNVTAEESAVYEARRASQLLGDWQAQLPTWRALGLANGQVDQAAIDVLLEGRQLALYSHRDGQVYHDASVTGAELDARLTLAMAEAALDQNENWSSTLPERTLDDAAVTLATVLRQTNDAQRSTEFDAPVVEPELTALAFLPPVLDYRLSAPAVFAELVPSSTSADPLVEADARLLLPDTELALGPAPELIDGETVIGDAIAEDRSFWFLALASYLDGAEAYATSQALETSSLTVTDRAGRACVAATFTGTDAATTTAISTALQNWAIAAPVEFDASATVLADGSAQLATCDPGVGFENGARFGAARELIGYRAGAMATLLVAEADASDEAISETLARYDASGIGAILAALPFDSTPAETAAAARSAVTGTAPAAPAAPVETPPAAEAVDPPPTGEGD